MIIKKILEIYIYYNPSIIYKTRMRQIVGAGMNLSRS